MNRFEIRRCGAGIAVIGLLACHGLPCETVRVAGSNLSLEVVWIPGGRALIGTPGDEPGRPAKGMPQERVLSPFWISKYEIAWDLYAMYYEGWRQAKEDGISRPSQPDVIDPRQPLKKDTVQSNRHPALGIGWYGAAGFCEWLSHYTKQPFRLPTEAEWEFACVAGSNPGDFSPLEDYAWYKDNSNGHSHPVGSKKPNGWGIYDMLGNVWEHCLEPYHPPESLGVVRGGAWNSRSPEVSSRYRQKILTEAWLENDPKHPLRAWWLTDAPFVGFRVIRLADDGETETERTEATKKIEIRKLQVVSWGREPYYLDRVTGEIFYSGSKPLDEVELKVYFLDENGKPMPIDPKGKPSFNKCYPVLVNSFHSGEQRKPLRSGETRAFALEIPHPFEESQIMTLEQVDASVSRIHFARPGG